MSKSKQPEKAKKAPKPEPLTALMRAVLSQWAQADIFGQWVIQGPKGTLRALEARCLVRRLGDETTVTAALTSEGLAEQAELWNTSDTEHPVRLVS